MINWKVRLKNKAFWVSVVPAILILLHKILIIFGIDFDYTVISSQLVDVIESVFLILGLIGIVNDPTTAGISDSEQAMTYEEPKC